MRGAVRVENVENPEQYITALLKRVKPQHIERTYNVHGFATPTEFLKILARKGGRLLKGGEADLDGVAKMVLNDFLRGKLPWFTAPPVQGEKGEKGIEGRHGALGEMGRMEKPQIDRSNARAAESGQDDTEAGTAMLDVDDQDDFEGFNDEIDQDNEVDNEDDREDGGDDSDDSDDESMVSMMEEDVFKVEAASIPQGEAELDSG